MINNKLLQPACNLEIDYSKVAGEKILPFLITLDLDTSILYPEPGQKQRFCYTVTGKGKDESIYADLSHLVFGICEQIAPNQIGSVSVIIDDEEQDVFWGVNIEIKTPEKPDPPTKCPGFKFDFGLDKVDGVMKICFELLTPYPIGPTPVCLYGGGTTAKSLSICGPVCTSAGNCISTGYQPAAVCVPVMVTPFANPLPTTTYCCNDPIITPNARECPGNVGGSCKFTITQKICIAVPVEFGAAAEVGSPSVVCGEATGIDVCTNCKEPETKPAEMQEQKSEETSETNICTDCSEPETNIIKSPEQMYSYITKSGNIRHF